MSAIDNIPEELKGKFEVVANQLKPIFAYSDTMLKNLIEGPVQFTFRSKAMKDLLTADESAQAISFVMRYEHLPVINNFNAVKQNDHYYLGNLSEIRYALNEYRSIIQNQEDSVFYGNVNRFCRGKLVNRDESKDLVLTVINKTGEDISLKFAAALDDQTKAIRTLLERMEFGYIYNGILQHSGHDFNDRLFEDYVSGQLNYVFVKHALVLGYFKARLYWHYTILNCLRWPKLGAL